MAVLKNSKSPSGMTTKKATATGVALSGIEPKAMVVAGVMSGTSRVSLYGWNTRGSAGCNGCQADEHG